jgi:hypothetical protein
MYGLGLGINLTFKVTLRGVSKYCSLKCFYFSARMELRFIKHKYKVTGLI